MLIRTHIWLKETCWYLSLLKELQVPTYMAMTSSSRAAIAISMAVQNSSLSKLQSFNGIFAIYKKQGPTSADVLNTLKKALLKGRRVFNFCSVILWFILCSWCQSSALGVEIITHKNNYQSTFYCVTSLSLHRGRDCKSQSSQEEEATFKNWPWWHPGQQCFWCTW